MLNTEIWSSVSIYPSNLNCDNSGNNFAYNIDWFQSILVDKHYLSLFCAGNILLQNLYLSFKNVFLNLPTHQEISRLFDQRFYFFKVETFLPSRPPPRKKIISAIVKFFKFESTLLQLDFPTKKLRMV